MRQTLTLLAFGLLLGMAGLSAQAKDAASSVPRPQAQAFLLGYTLQSCDLRAMEFTQSVKALGALYDSDGDTDKAADVDKAAGAEVAHLSRQAVKLRRAQAASYWQVARTLTALGAPKTLHDWATATANRLDADLVYSDDDQALAKKEPDTGAVLAELDEVRAVKEAANAHQPILAAWLKLNGGVLAVWTADLGSYAAGLRAAVPPPYSVARRLLLTAPPGTPSEVRGDLSELIPPGGGNLQDMATISSAGDSAALRTRVYDKLMVAYDAVETERV